MRQQLRYADSHSKIGGWITVEHKKFDGYDLKNPIHVEGTNHTYFLPKFKKRRYLAFWKHNLLTNGGRDQMHSQVYNETNATNTERGGGYIAVTTDTAAASASDTTLASEITTGGLGRADATTNTHTTGTNTTTLAKTFTASATHTAVHKSGTFDASSAGILYHEAVFGSDATLVSGDTLTVTWTLTLG
jgi:hypothetical protein